MKPICFLFLCAIFAVTCRAQDICASIPENAPQILGLRLEMSPAEVQKVFGKDLKIKIRKDGERSFFQNFIKKPAPNSLKDVRALYLRFFDRKLYQIEVFYQTRNDVKTVENFTDSLAGETKIPNAAWQKITGKLEISCPKFYIFADNVLNPRIQFTAKEIFEKVLVSRKKQ